MMKKIISMDVEETIAQLMPNNVELDLARSAWFDQAFAIWFYPFAKSSVLFNGSRGEAFFAACGEFAAKHKTAAADSGDDASVVLKDQAALDWFRSMKFDPLPGERNHKPTSWQIEKARNYLRSRHNIMLAERLNDSERVREEGDSVRADMIANDARRIFCSFNDVSVKCTGALDDVDEIMSLADSNPPLFTLDGELGQLLNPRLKCDNLGVILGSQKIGKTTTLVSIAVAASKCVPTLFISAGDETKKKIDGRIFTNLSCLAVQPEFAGTFAMPVPDCAHNANGTCPIGQSGEPRQVKDWKLLIDEGHTPMDILHGCVDGCKTVSGGIYRPCTRCFPKRDGSKEDIERLKNWKSAVWWREETFNLRTRQDIIDTRNHQKMVCSNGELRTAAYPTGELTVDMISELLERLDRTENFVPQVVVLDYADILKQTDLRGMDKDHDGMRIIWEKLRSLTSRLNILLITATQTNRSGNDADTQTVHTIGRCAKAADNCTWLLTLNQTVSEKRSKVMRTSMLFAREGSFDPEQQALCYQWHEVQDSFAFSSYIFRKIKPFNERNQ